MQTLEEDSIEKQALKVEDMNELWLALCYYSIKPEHDLNAFFCLKIEVQEEIFQTVKFEKPSGDHSVLLPS